MFGVYFGKYLEDIGVLTKEQYLEIVEASRNNRLKMGFLAVNEGFMTQEQAEEINQLQAIQDARFGDLAVGKEYLTETQVMELLKKQGDSYLLFVQSVVERKLLSLEEIQKYINQFKRNTRLTALDIDALKSADVDRIIPLFTKDSTMSPIIKDYVALMARNIIRFIDNKVRFEKIERKNTYTAKYIASQDLSGDYEIFIGVCGDDDGVKKFGEIFAKEKFDAVDEDVLDAICEFINVCNGIFASKLSIEDIDVDMLPPNMYTETTTINSEGIMYLLPFYIKESRIDLLICLESKWNINKF